MKRWFPEVVAYFEKRITNGIVQGINNKLKLLKRCVFRFNNFHNFEILALLFWHFPYALAQQVPENQEVLLIFFFQKRQNRPFSWLFFWLGGTEV
ncbi:transposase [Aerosakkonema funiforme]|uniref:transposase n=1 Tax=Aerosakkonema funiforme TaxID=1246630 RepID=UPI001F54ADE3